ncbi:hypothetical protein IAU60_006749 [Kwoniella sp. DSM 27419]
MEDPVQPLFTTTPLCRPGAGISPTPADESSPWPVSTCPATMSKNGSSSQPTSAYPSMPSSPTGGSICFAKVPIPVPSSTTVSTDSEATSDWQSEAFTRSGAQSPSLISTLFACQPRPNSQSYCHSQSQTQSQTQSGMSRTRPTAGSSSSSPSHPAPSTPGRCTKPILRRDTTTTSASEDCREYSYRFSGYDLKMPKVSTLDGQRADAQAGTQAQMAPTPPVLKKRHSALTFAIASPRVKINPAVPSSRSTSVSPASSYARTRASPPPALQMPAWSTICTEEAEEEEDDDYDEEEDEDEGGYCESPLPIPGHESDSDEGYQEDEEGGFTSDEEEADGQIGFQRPGTFTGPRLKHRPEWAPAHWASSTHVLNGGNASTPKRRATTFDTVLSYPTSTDDCEPGVGAYTAGPGEFSGLRGRKTSIAIVANTKPSTSSCTRHRSPPPPRTASAGVVAPPAARSPSAADLCRRRGSASAGGSTMLYAKRGWKSDDSAFFSAACGLPSVSRRPTAPAAMYESQVFQLPSAGTGPSVDPAHGTYHRKGSLPTPTLGHQCKSILRSAPVPEPGPVPASALLTPEPESVPMQRSSGVPPVVKDALPPTPPLDCQVNLNLLRRGSAPAPGVEAARATAQDQQRFLGTGLGIAGAGVGLARSATGCEGEVKPKDPPGRLVRCV